MTHFNISADVAAILATATPATKGDLYEWALCHYFGIERTKHDNSRYDKGSDIELPNGQNISVKFGGCSLMYGGLCEGQTTMDGIWGVFERNVHSNMFAVITSMCDVFMMTLAEFKEYTFTFATIQRESSCNGGYAKIKFNNETKKRVRWLIAKAGV